MHTDAELPALLAVSARLGRDPLRTQAAGGNTSLKRDGIMWIKASGTWLADAEDRPVMVPVRLEPLLAAFQAGDRRAETATDFVAGDYSGGLRPSVETAVHAVIPFPVVIHIHCVATIALAVRTDAETVIGERLAPIRGIEWAFVPYVHPGVTLARVLAARLRPATNVIVLGNHGLVVAGRSVSEAADLVDRIFEAFNAPCRRGTSPDLRALENICRQGVYRLPGDPTAHSVATEVDNLAIASQGSLYPDHVVFLGRGITLMDDASDARAPREREAWGPPLLVVPGKGVLISKSALRGADELARGLADVVGRIPEGSSVHCLSRADEDALINWDAEAYRLGLAAKRTG